MITIPVNMIETTAAAVCAIYIGIILKRRIKFLDRFCIPVPVIGGLLFAFIALAGNLTQTFSFKFDYTLQEIFMTAFYTSVGYSASIKTVKSGSSALIVLICVVAILIVMQDIIAISFAHTFDMHPLLALCTGSVSMAGGHGTAIAFGEMIEKTGVTGAENIALVAATFGLAVGGLIGSPVGKRLIDKKKLLNTVSSTNDFDAVYAAKTTKIDSISAEYLSKGIFQIIIAMGIGSLLSRIIESTGLLFPSYAGALVVAVILRNIVDFTGVYKVYSAEIDAVGHACLLLFVTMALMGLRLWELAELAMPMLAMLGLQTFFMILFVYFIAFKLLGKDYDAAVISAGVCGFGMGATPNAMANMEALTKHYARPSPKAFLIIPIVGGMFIDIFNSLFIIICINIFK